MLCFDINRGLCSTGFQFGFAEVGTEEIFDKKKQNLLDDHFSHVCSQHLIQKNDNSFESNVLLLVVVFFSWYFF